MAFGTNFTNKILDHIFGGHQDLIRPNNIKIALYTSNPNFDTGLGGTECGYANYARVLVANTTTNFGAALARQKKNTTKNKREKKSTKWKKRRKKEKT